MLVGLGVLTAVLWLVGRTAEAPVAAQPVATPAQPAE
jgi:hypothetical protein